jgi:three-Cys-motif partner protein
MSRKDNEQYVTDPRDGRRIELVRPWVEEKHHLLRGYVDASRGARAKLRGTPTYVDLYCGPGLVRISDTGVEHVGGALAAVQAAAAPSTGKAAPYTRAILADMVDINVTACADRLKEALALTATTFVGEAVSTASEVVRALPAKGLHLAFLDPYAIDQLPFSVIEQFARAPHVDLIIHFASGDMARNLSRPEIYERFDDAAPGWRSILERTSGKGLRRRRFFEHWKGLFAPLKYHVSEKAFPVKNTRGREIYRLVLASKHELGSNIWKTLNEYSPQANLF